MKKHLLLLFFALLFVAIPSKVFAQEAKKLDSKCFTKAECQAARQSIGRPSTEEKIGIYSEDSTFEGFYNNTSETRTTCEGKRDSNGEELGFCLPVGQSVTTVKFGGNTRFANIGVFIQYIYRYGIIFAGILAVLVIIVSGLQWTASGGNSSTIESAKTRITGALTGLVLASASYIILNTINPSTINLRLPQVWLIRADKIENNYEYCLAMPAVPNSTDGFTIPKVAPYTSDPTSLPESAYKQAFSIQGNDRITKGYFPDKLESPITPCGAKMIIKDSGGSSCTGTYCPPGQYCDAKSQKCDATLFPQGGIGGFIKWEPGSGKYVDYITLKVACIEDDGSLSINDVESFNTDEAITHYAFDEVPDAGRSICDGADKVKGYFFKIELNDGDDVLEVTKDDQWVGGKSFCRNPAGKSCGIWGQSSINDSDIQDLLILDAMDSINEFFRPADMERGVSCDFNITEQFMPGLGSGFFTLIKSGALSVLGLGSAGNPGNAIGADTCPYLQAKKDQFNEAIKTRYEAKNPGKTFNP